MSDLNSVAIENLLHEGALRRGVTVDAYRALIGSTPLIASVLESGM